MDTHDLRNSTWNKGLFNCNEIGYKMLFNDVYVCFDCFYIVMAAKINIMICNICLISLKF